MNWIVGNLQNALDTWNGKLSEIYSLVTQSPADFKGGVIWDIITNINGALQAIGVALLVLFFVMGVVKTMGKQIDYSIAVPACYYANNDFRRYNPNFTEFKLFLMGVGCIKIPPIDVTANGLKIRYAIDWDSGNATVSVRRSDGVHIISEHTFQFLVPIKIAQVNSGVDNIIGAASSIAGGIISGGVSGLISSAIGGINGLSKVMTEGTSGNGAFGNRVAYITYPYITLFQTAYDSAEFPTVVAGRPLYKNVNINTLNGYVQCANASIDIPALGNDRDTVNGFLNNGFYYE